MPIGFLQFESWFADNSLWEVRSLALTASLIGANVSSYLSRCTACVAGNPAPDGASRVRSNLSLLFAPVKSPLSERSPLPLGVCLSTDGRNLLLVGRTSLRCWCVAEALACCRVGRSFPRGTLALPCVVGCSNSPPGFFPRCCQGTCLALAPPSCSWVSCPGMRARLLEFPIDFDGGELPG